MKKKKRTKILLQMLMMKKMQKLDKTKMNQNKLCKYIYKFTLNSRTVCSFM